MYPRFDSETLVATSLNSPALQMISAPDLWLSHGSHVVFAWQAAYPAGHFQLEKCCKYLGGGQLRLQQFEKFVDLDRLVGAQNLKHHDLLWPQHRVRQ